MVSLSRVVSTSLYHILMPTVVVYWFSIWPLRKIIAKIIRVLQEIIREVINILQNIIVEIMIHKYYMWK